MTGSVKKVRSGKSPSWRPAARRVAQAEKSQRMQTAILEATLQCCVEIGYARTTMEKIAKKARASLGAVMHHFKSRAEVIKAAAAYVVEKRAQEFWRLLADLDAEPVPEGSLVTLEGMKLTMSLLADYYSLPSFVALHELMTAARTDEELRDVLLPLERELDKKIAASMRSQFPLLKLIEETRQVLADVQHFALQGLAVSPEPYVSKQRVKRMADFLATIATSEITAAYERAQKAKRSRSGNGQRAESA